MMNLKPFTFEHAPAGYSRQDCENQLAIIDGQIETTKVTFIRLYQEKKVLQDQLKDGGTKL